MQELTRKNLKQLWRLRNVAIGCEVTVLLLAIFVLGMALPVWPLCLVLAFQLAVNGLTRQRLHQPAAPSERYLFCQLLLDVSTLFVLLLLTGGAANPFTSLFILQVIIAATILTPRHSWIVSAVAIGYYTLLIAFWTDHAAMVHPPEHQQTVSIFSLHIYGMWGSFVLLAGLVVWFVGRLQATIRRQNALLADAEQIALLGAAAASAAHELGTPLSTMALLAEANLEEAQGNHARDRAVMLKEQIARCKQIISLMALKAGLLRAESGHMTRLDTWLTELVTRWQAQMPRHELKTQINVAPVPVVAEYALEQAILNLLENAAQAGPSTPIHFHATSDSKTLTLTIHDSGPGFPDSILQRMRAPVLSNKPDGMGMGLFLTQLIVTRMDGSLILTNDNGAAATITLPLLGLKP